MIWWDQWELTRWNSLLAPCLKNVFGTLNNYRYIVTERLEKHLSASSIYINEQFDFLDIKSHTSFWG